MTIEQAITAVQGGTSPRVASMLYGVSVTEIELAMPERGEQLAPGYAKPATKEVIEEVGRSHREDELKARRDSQRALRAATRAKKKATPRPKKKRVRRPNQSGTSRAGALPHALICKKMGVTRATLQNRLKYNPRWRRAEVTDKDRERVGLSNFQGARYVYWVELDLTQAKLAKMGRSSRSAMTAEALARREGIAPVKAYQKIIREGWRRRHATEQDYRRLRCEHRRANYVYWEDKER